MAKFGCLVNFYVRITQYQKIMLDDYALQFRLSGILYYFHGEWVNIPCRHDFTVYFNVLILYSVRSRSGPFCTSISIKTLS